MDPAIRDQRLTDLERRLAHVESLLMNLSQLLERSPLNLEAAQEGIKSWVTEYVSLRLQQLVPERCEHAPEPEGARLRSEAGEGPVLPGTTIRCTDEVMHRLGRIPIPFVRQMVAQKVADTARAEGVAFVDVAFFERAATF
ncbi:MAG: hypothetical protein HY725_22635 [Candidatus Rokubacteria bacterium]|nr:hypothetical protein [Candidatus Rokubacteria bacterium]